MEKAIIIGCPGAGKSTFARKLKEKTGLPLFYLDMPWVESEFDLEFRQFIVDFPKDSLPKIYELLKKYEKEKELHFFRKREDAEEYLRTEERNGKV